MSEEKVYVVKTDEGKFLSFSFETDKQKARLWAHNCGGHVVSLIEEPEKVVLTKEQAEIVENACYEEYPVTYISGHTGDEEELLMNAYVNGYIVAKEKKYGVWVPHINNKMYYKDGRGSDDLDIASADCLNDKNQQFTEAEIEHYGLGDCQKVVCADSARTTGEVKD